MTIPTNGLDFYLPFDADMDEKIHSLTGTLSSSSAATYFMLSSDTAVGKFLRCIKTQGSSSYYLKYPGSESLMQYGTGDFSLSFWMRAPDWGNFTHVVFEKKYNDDYDGFVVFKVLAPLNLCCRLRKGSGEDSVDILTASAANSDKFIHWCFIRDAGGGRWYCNGLQEATSGELINECIEGGCNVDPGRAIGVNVSNSEIFKIGYSASWSSKQAVFDLKALRIYNRALSDSEITELSKEFSGTSSLDTVLVALDGARDALVTAINAKGGSLADNATLYQCAETVGSLSAGGTSVEYYKCASVDTSAKTWTGYKAVFDSGTGTWSFESDVTEGLTYTSVTPQVGSTYNADATLTVMLHGLLFSDIIAYYKFDDNLNNYVSQYGAATSSNTTYVDGKSGKALLFNGSTSKCIVPKDISVRGRSRVSISLWFNINSLGSKNVLYAEENKKTYFFRFGLEVLSTGNILGALRNFDSDATYKSIDGGSVSLQEWHFAVFTFDAHSQIAKLHIDGVLKGTVATSSDPIPDTAPARTISVGYFDGASSSDTGVIDGMIDELCIRSKALTDTEVSELYNNGVGKFL